MRFRPAHLSVVAGLAGSLLLAPAAFAADGESTPLNLGEPKAEAAAQQAGSGGGLVRTIVGLAVVLGVIYGLHWVLKHVKASREEKATGSGLEQLSTLPLGPNRSLQLVRAGSEIVLVGVSEHGVTPVRTYQEDEARALGLLAEPGTDPAPTGAPLPGLPAERPTVRTALTRALDDLRSKTVIR
jgi:flagellar protein FliO/FliZ